MAKGDFLERRREAAKQAEQVFEAEVEPLPDFDTAELPPMSSLSDFNTRLETLQMISIHLAEKAGLLCCSAAQIGDYRLLRQLGVTFKTFVGVADVVTGLKMHVSLEASHKLLSSQGYLIFRNKEEIKRFEQSKNSTSESQN
jgi:hypothetical protein